MNTNIFKIKKRIKGLKDQYKKNKKDQPQKERE